MTTTREYSSTDPGAPVITGQPGTAMAAIVACTVGVGGIAYGSGPTAKPAAGWSAPYGIVGNVAVIKNSVAAGGTGVCVRLDDSGSTAAGARELGVKCYANMSDINTGVGADIMPDTALYPAGGTILKSDVLSATPRAWRIFADELTAYIWISLDGAFNEGFHGFGDLASEVPSDAFRSMMIYQGAVWSSGTNASRIATGASETLLSPNSIFQSRGVSVMRGYAGVSPGSVQAGVPVFGRGSANPLSGASGGAGAPATSVTSPGSGEQYFMPMVVCAEGMLRGRLRGLYAATNDLRSLPSGTQRYAASGLPPSSVLRLLRATNGGTGNNSNVGTIAVETSLPW